MEVHSHSHTPRQKWSHYVWEFLMLFLAITTGFFVENQREHYIEHQRAKVYAKTMKANLSEDIVELKQMIYRGTFASAYLDSFLLLLSNNDISRIPSGKLYWYGLFGAYIRGFQPNDATFQQMKGSGSIRYFSNDSLEQLVSNYDQQMRSMHDLTQIDERIALEVRKLRARLFDFKFNNAANSVVQRAIYERYNKGSYNQAMIDSFIGTNPPLLSSDRIVFNEYAELCRSRSLRRHLINTREALKTATEIIERLSKQYHLE